MPAAQVCIGAARRGRFETMKRKKKSTTEVEGPLHYRVSIPIAGSVTVFVEALDEEEAIERAWEKVGDDDADVAWECHEKICEGNLLHVSQNEIEVDLAE